MKKYPSTKPNDAAPVQRTGLLRFFDCLLDRL